MNIASSKFAGKVLVIAIHNVEPWWRHIGEHLGFEESKTVSDLRGEGDYNIIPDFYPAFRRFYKEQSNSSDLLSEKEVKNIISRCRLLRWLPKRKAAAMALAAAEAFENIISEYKPALIVSFPIDRYTKDVWDRRARAHNIPYFEFTASALPEMAMLLYRGQLVKDNAVPDAELVEKKRMDIADPNFTPSYVQGKTKYTAWKFLKTFGYFRLRGWIFKLISWVKRDPLSLHYLDAQSFLGHKPRLSDIRITKMIEYDWREKVEAFDKERRLFLGLQLFPEASIDYWVKDLGLVDYENMLVDMAKAFTDAGFQILVKDHPLQFGFRQVELLERLKQFPNVVIIPYDVSGNEVMAMSATNFTLTGTLGLQAALTGLKSITTDNYYTNDEDFIIFRSREEIASLPKRVLETVVPENLADRQRRICSNLLAGSFESDFFSFGDFEPENPKSTIADMAAILGRQLHKLGPDNFNWHATEGAGYSASLLSSEHE
jgi:hypothetical protein